MTTDDQSDTVSNAQSGVLRAIWHGVLHDDIVSHTSRSLPASTGRAMHFKHLLVLGTVLSLLSAYPAHAQPRLRDGVRDGVGLVMVPRILISGGGGGDERVP